MKYFFALIIIAILFCSCKNENEKFFPVSSFIASQIEKVDTALYEIKIITKENNSTDTIVINRKEFRKYAQDFISLPDISQKKFSGQYTEQKKYDADLNQAIISYAPKKFKKGILMEEIFITPDAKKDEVSSIYINYLTGDKDSLVQKHLIWETDTRFRITTITDKSKQQKNIKIVTAEWR